MKKILLCCNQGMSTSLLVQKIEKEIAARGVDVQIEARPWGLAKDKVNDYDVVLLGPQISYALKEAQKISDGTPVQVIPMADYGRMNAAAILDNALKTMGA